MVNVFTGFFNIVGETVIHPPLVIALNMIQGGLYLPLTTIGA